MINNTLSRSIENLSEESILPAPTLPLVYTIELTTVCNNFCSGCANSELSRDARDRKNNITYMTRWKSIVDIIVAQQTPETIIRISGGEPTAHPDFLKIVQYIEDSCVPFAVFSTGRWGSKKKREAVIKVLSECHYLLGMLISLHGHNAETHCAFTGAVDKSFRETCTSIQKAASSGVTIFTNSVIHRKNINSLSNIISLSESLGATYAVFNRFIAYEHPLIPIEHELKKAIISINKLRVQGHKCKIGNSLPRCFMALSSYPAPAGYELCHISPDGSVRPDNFSHFSFGNILQQELKNIWKSEKAVFFRDTFPSQCMNCAALPACRGGLKSPVFQYAAFSDPLIGNPLTLEDIISLDDDKDKADARFRALTSD